jgi:hypothetical protein
MKTEQTEAWVVEENEFGTTIDRHDGSGPVSLPIGRPWLKFAQDIVDAHNASCHQESAQESNDPKPLTNRAFNKMTDEMRAMNDRWAAIHELLQTPADGNWDNAPFVAIRKLQEAAQADTEAENIKNAAWFDAMSRLLGSTQLSHAVAKIESLEKNAAHNLSADSAKAGVVKPKTVSEAINMTPKDWIESTGAKENEKV